MTRLWIVLGLALTATLGAPLGANVDPQTVTAGLRVFEDANFRGRGSTITRDISNLESVGMNDQISSLRAAPGERWEVCEHAGYKGRCQIVSGNEPDLGRTGFDNIISSVRKRSDGGSGEAAPGFGPSRGVYLFAGTRWTGERVAITSATTNLERNGFNDRANSIQVARGEIWEVCEHSNYGGRCVEVSADLTDLNSVGLSRTISSLRRRNTGEGGGIGPGPARAVLYSDYNFGGRALSITNSRTSLGDFQNIARSLDVVTGRWEVCDQQNYRGNCREVTGGVRDLRTIGMNNRIQSIRRR